ncbi:hypothetical protein [Pseudogemmobacter faecipullorum]|uniref:Uncharacterized protein n=1 Tax=Pseudogemmobacter faecipullorum TaxID=2755041 RepID=A0ABS8CSM4_9RHOB|nr:hypothetical protein [Pseudogemmobacter faecipullorum]MCB5412402.1 hypothetical protein [Pseudogemmobacter faecipullorum]
MTYTGSTEGFRSAGRVLISQALAQLQLAQRYPLTVSCSGEARYLDPELEQWAFERSVDLGTCDSLVDAMMLVSTRLGSGRVSCLLCMSDPVHASSKGSMHDDLQGTTG